MSYVSIIFTIFAWKSGLQFSQSELLPIMISSSINLLMFFIYKILYIKDDINKKYIKFIYLGGFYINLFFVGFCIVVILGIRVAP
ncbi:MULTISPECIES: hypothetical protein [Clostridium]|uniref:Uncharacterized protein n=2 Tax=Clostridium botulinum TaxID=1491 RepID=C4IXQ7_CLOBO|nr:MULTISPECIES: hypothetical protein [Clostridium]KMJ93095.1 hypothetical protein CBCST_22615 [Clostridium botulinum C str. Stockholm]MBO3441982.1 hypothetical protein [Clostridium haemolyticum]BAH29607.1 hypothetical protein [Clostridium botulinum]